MHQGTELGQLVRQLHASIALLRPTRYRLGVEDHLVFLQAIRTLQGLSLQQEDLAVAGTALDERGLPAGLTEESGKLPEYEILRLGVACLLRDFGRAFAISTAVAGQLNRVPRFVQHVSTTSTPPSRSPPAAAAPPPTSGRRSWRGSRRTRSSWPLGEEQPRELRAQAPDRRGRAGPPPGHTVEAADLYDRAITAAGTRWVPARRGAGQRAVRPVLSRPGPQTDRGAVSVRRDRRLRALGRQGEGGRARGGLALATLTVGRMQAPAERGPTHDKTGGAALDFLPSFAPPRRCRAR